MKAIPFLAVFSLLPACAVAQVSVNQAALQQLAGIAPPPVAAPLPPAAPVPARVHHHATHIAHKAPAAAVKPPAPVAVAAHPGAAPALPAPKPATPPPAPAPAKIAPPALVRVAFAPGSAALPADAAAALKPFCASGAPVPIAAPAPANPSDPSSAMRLSLARAFALRDALTACGVPAQNILPRATGPVPGVDDNQALIGAGAAPGSKP